MAGCGVFELGRLDDRVAVAIIRMSIGETTFDASSFFETIANLSI
jgi:hypothetical protein